MFPACGVANHYVDIGIFKLSAIPDELHRDWRKKIVDVIIKYCEVDANLKV